MMLACLLAISHSLIQSDCAQLKEVIASDIMRDRLKGSNAFELPVLPMAESNKWIIRNGTCKVEFREGAAKTTAEGQSVLFQNQTLAMRLQLEVLSKQLTDKSGTVAFVVPVNLSYFVSVRRYNSILGAGFQYLRTTFLPLTNLSNPANVKAANINDMYAKILAQLEPKLVAQLQQIVDLKYLSWSVPILPTQYNYQYPGASLYFNYSLASLQVRQNGNILLQYTGSILGAVGCQPFEIDPDQQVQKRVMFVGYSFVQNMINAAAVSQFFRNKRITKEIWNVPVYDYSILQSSFFAPGLLGKYKAPKGESLYLQCTNSTALTGAQRPAADFQLQIGWNCLAESSSDNSQLFNFSAAVKYSIAVEVVNQQVEVQLKGVEVVSSEFKAGEVSVEEPEIGEGYVGAGVGMLRGRRGLGSGLALVGYSRGQVQALESSLRVEAI